MRHCIALIAINFLNNYKMDSNTSHKFQNFCQYALAAYNYKLFQSLKGTAKDAGTHDADILTLNELFKFVESNFAELHNPNNLLNLLPILHYAIQFEAKSTTTQIQLTAILQMLLSKYKHNEKDQKLVLQIIYQLFNSVVDYGKTDIAENADEWFHTLSDLLFSCGKSLAPNVVVCLQRHVQKLQRADLLELLWQRIVEQKNNKKLSPRIALILVHLIDDFLQCKQGFYGNEHLVEFLQKLLTSAEREERKASVYLLRKIIPYMVKGAGEVDNSVSLNYSWSAYATILESLEDNQSHLILPTLATLKNITLNKVWIELLYSQLLQHGNSLVLRWIVEHMLDNFKCSDLSEVLLHQFLDATNDTYLYNPDNYCIPKAKLETFLEGDLDLFFVSFGNINWKSVPMYFWFSTIQDMKKPTTHKITWNTLMKIAIRVRVLQNKNIRAGVICLFDKIFHEEIEGLTLSKHLKLIESLLNPFDIYKSWDVIIKKLTETYINSNDVVFTKRLYEIFTDYIKGDLNKQDSLLRTFQNIPKAKHGWLRLMFVFEFEISEKYSDFCRCKYGIDFLESVREYPWEDLVTSERNGIEITPEKALEEYIKILSHSHPNKMLQWFTEGIAKKLVWEKGEEEFVIRKAFDYVATKNIQCQSGLRMELLQALLSKGGEGTLLELSNLKASPNDNTEFFDCILQEIGRFSENTDWCYKVYRNLFNSIERNLSKELSDKYTKKILRIDEGKWRRQITTFMALFDSNLAYTNMDDIVDTILKNGIFHGDARIELFYECKIPNNIIHKDFCRGYDLCSKAIENFKKLNDQTLFVDLIKYLLNMNYTLSCKRPRYFENSPVHVIKMRIAIAICKILKNMACKYWTDSCYWDIILEENNQLNITCIYERIIAYCAPNIDEIFKYLNKLSEYPPAQQVSIIIVCYLYCCTHWSRIDDSVKEEIIYKVLPFTMGANFQIRLHSQLVIYKMMLKREENKLSTSVGLTAALRSHMYAIRLALGERLDELINDVRLIIDDENLLNAEELLYITNAPWDEVPCYQLSELSKRREDFCKKRKEKNRKCDADETGNIEVVDVQRKLDPLMDILPSSDLILYPEYKAQKEKENDIVVVASLIDKLPNLGGVARTCEVLGIKHLILHSKTYIHNNDFKNISMTAEKGLIINEVKRESLFEFLLQKQIEGYEIVGAEQTANSQSFVDFKFPKKCIILLGHEKEGIPSNLLSILNHAVEIPQFGLVRSLNVHVTAALFMWEYCKQHIV